MSKLADKMYAKYTGKVPVAFNLDKETYDKFSSILWSLIEAFKECKKTDTQVLTVAHRPANSDVKMVKRAVRKELGFVKNLFTGSSYVQAVLDAGKESTLDEVQEVYK